MKSEKAQEREDHIKEFGVFLDKNYLLRYKKRRILVPKGWSYPNYPQSKNYFRTDKNSQKSTFTGLSDNLFIDLKDFSKNTSEVYKYVLLNIKKCAR